MSKIIDAARFAKQAHAGQIRKFTGRQYITHPARVAIATMLHPLGTENLVCAAWLHDTIEDCGATWLELDGLFGSEVADWVLWMTNQSKDIVPEPSRAKKKALDRARLQHAPPEIKILKLLDRIDNLRELPRDSDLWQVYLQESLLLLEVLRGVDPALEEELVESCK